MDTPYFGKNGFHSPQSIHRKEKTLNLNKLDQLLQKNQTEINLTDMGYTKLLGTGKINKALTITVPACSKTAAEKIQTAGGKVLMETEEAEVAEPE
jgi:large subunit ribosomal protein L15